MAAGANLAAYRDDPVAWVHDCIDWRDGEGPAPYQDEIMATIPKQRRVAVRGPHGLGKTAMESWVLLWFATTRDGEDWKCPTTASAWRQLTHYLWPEIRKWARRLRWDRLGRSAFDMRRELLTLNLKLSTGEAFALACEDPTTIEGAHADQLLYLFDEAKSIPGETFDSAEGAFSGNSDTYSVVVSTPGEPSGRFYDIHRRAPGYEDWYVRHVTLDEMLAAGRQSAAWVEQRRRQWGESSAVYQNRVLGEFASSDEDGVIPLAWVELANDRWYAQMETEGPLLPLTCLGVDVGVTQDKTTIALRHDNLIADPIRKYGKEDTMATAGRVKGLLDELGGYAMVDGIGVGAGVVHRLREQRADVRSFIAGEKSHKKDISGELGFANLRAEAWWGLRERLDPANDPTIALPPDNDLTGELTEPKWRVQSGGKILIESKQDVRKRREGRSTDVADAVVMAFADPNHGGVLPFGWMS